jgi:hypothetical protein
VQIIPRVIRATAINAGAPILVKADCTPAVSQPPTVAELVITVVY